MLCIGFNGVELGPEDENLSNLKTGHYSLALGFMISRISLRRSV